MITKGARIPDAEGTMQAGLTTGVVVDSGDGETHIVPVYDGFALPHLMRRLDIAGRDVMRYLIKLLLMCGYAFNLTADFKTVRGKSRRSCATSGAYPFHSPLTSCQPFVLASSYDLDMDTRLAEETTMLVESYTMTSCPPFSHSPSDSLRSSASRRPNDQSRL